MSNKPFYIVVVPERYSPDMIFVECEDEGGRSLSVGEWKPYRGNTSRVGPFFKADDVIPFEDMMPLLAPLYIFWRENPDLNTPAINAIKDLIPKLTDDQQAKLRSLLQ